MGLLPCHILILGSQSGKTRRPRRSQNREPDRTGYAGEDLQCKRNRGTRGWSVFDNDGERPNTDVSASGVKNIEGGVERIREWLRVGVGEKKGLERSDRWKKQGTLNAVEEERMENRD